MEQSLGPHHLAKSIHFPLVDMSKQNPHLGQPSEKKLSWAFYVSQLQTGGRNH